MACAICKEKKKVERFFATQHMWEGEMWEQMPSVACQGVQMLVYSASESCPFIRGDWG